MSDELFPATTTEQAPATQLTPELLAEIQGKLAGAVGLAEEAIDFIRAAAGPQPGRIPQEMITGINRGAAHFREGRDTIGRLFKEWRALVRQQTCAHDKGLNHTARRSFCKLCELEFVHDRARNEFVPLGGAGK